MTLSKQFLFRGGKKANALTDGTSAIALLYPQALPVPLVTIDMVPELI